MASDPRPTILPWLHDLPLAPEYHPTPAEFRDPIAYILKIEPEASSYGICKIIPPFPSASKKSFLSNLARSFAALRPRNTDPPTFPTRRQRVSLSPSSRPAQNPGEHRTLTQFQAAAKQFERTHLKKSGKKPLSTLSPLETETLFWEACVATNNPITVESAADIPGSGFAALASGKRWREEEPRDLGESAWNMRGVSRAKGSALRFKREDVPRVTSPVVDVGMMFSWSAWHEEDHELHCLNFLHKGSGKAWYGVPRDARFAFEEVVRVQACGGEVNPVVTYSILHEKAVVMSPEVLIGAGIPCCRLVQNAGEFFVSFPGAYHSGFSYGFNCGEAANIATPEWLRYAKEAAIRRASANYPPILSHFQLLYALSLPLCSRIPASGGTEPRSSRLKDKMRGEGELMVKTMFVQDLVQNNNLLSYLLDKDSSCIVLPQNALEGLPLYSNSLIKSQERVNSRSSLSCCSHLEPLDDSSVPSNDEVLGSNAGIRNLKGLSLLQGDSVSELQRSKITYVSCRAAANTDLNSSTSDSKHVEGERERTRQCDGLLNQGLVSCVTCGILSFTCVAVIQPRELTARYLMSAGCGLLSHQIIGSGETGDGNHDGNMKLDKFDLVSGSGQKEWYKKDMSDNNSVQYGAHPFQDLDHNVDGGSCTATQKPTSALDLLASAYGDASDSEDENLRHPMCVCTAENDLNDLSLSSKPNNKSAIAIKSKEVFLSKVPPEGDCQIRWSTRSVHCTTYDSDGVNELRCVSPEDKCQSKLEFSGLNHPRNPTSVEPNSVENNREIPTSCSSFKTNGEPKDLSSGDLGNTCHSTRTVITHQSDIKMENTESDAKIMNFSISTLEGSDKSSSGMHVFCLEHALEVQKQLHPIGGSHIMLFCHPGYPKLEAEGKLLAEELGIDYMWKDISFREATEEDKERILAALGDKESFPVNSDWSVKLGINLYHSVSLCKSPLNRKQLPFNAIIYKAFGCSSSSCSTVSQKAPRKRPHQKKKILVAGRWCGKVWMSTQVHPYLAPRNGAQEREDCERLHFIAVDNKSNIETETKPDNVTAEGKPGKRKKPIMHASSKKLMSKHSNNSSKPIKNEPEILTPEWGMVLRSKRLKHIAVKCELNLKDEAEEGLSTRLRKRPVKYKEVEPEIRIKKQISKGESRKIMDEVSEYTCDIEGCSMSFTTKEDLTLHKRDICPVNDCLKKFFSHKYLVQHQKVHMDDRPLECPWKGCKMRFKWSWSRTEHIRVHTGDRPYVCGICCLTFRFVSDFSRHKRKTGHCKRFRR